MATPASVDGSDGREEGRIDGCRESGINSGIPRDMFLTRTESVSISINSTSSLPTVCSNPLFFNIPSTSRCVPPFVVQ